MRELEFDNGHATPVGETVGDIIPWCPSCGCYSVPNENDNCGDCGRDITYR